MTETNKSWITSKSIAIAARIPIHLHDLIEEYGKKYYPNSKGYDKTATILDLLRRGLEMGDDEVVLQSVKQSVNQETVEQLVQQAVKQELLNIDVLQTLKQEDNDRLGEIEAAIALINERLDRLEKERIAKLDPEIELSPLETTKNQLKQDFEDNTENHPSEDDLEATKNDNQDIEAIKQGNPNIEAISEREAEKPDIKGVEGEGLTDKQLADLLTKMGQKTTFSTVNRWRNGKTSPTGKNKDLFEEWEVRGDRWFPKGC